MTLRLTALFPGLLYLLACLGLANSITAQLIVQFEVDVSWSPFDIDVNATLDPATDQLIFENTGPDELDPIPIPGWLIPPGQETFDTGLTFDESDTAGIAICVGFHMGRLIVKHWIIEIGAQIRGIIEDFRDWLDEIFGEAPELPWDEMVCEEIYESMDFHAAEQGY